jgi:hypothetical protein
MAIEKTILNQQESLKAEDSEMSVKDVVIKVRNLYRYVISKWFIIIICGIAGAFLGYEYSIYKKPVYNAVTTFVLGDDSGGGGGLGQYSDFASMVGLNVGGSSGGVFQGDNILQLYKSRSMLQKTLLSEVAFNNKKQLLIDKYIDFNHLRARWNKKPELEDIQFGLKQGQSFSRTQDSIIGDIIGKINKSYLTVIKPDKKLNIINVSVISENELFSKAFNDQLVKNVNEFYVQTKTKKNVDNLEILQHQTDSVRNVLNGAIYQSAIVADATPNLNITRQILRAPAQRSQFNAEANKAILTQLVQNLELAKISLRKQTPLIQVIDYPVLPLDVDKVGKIGAIITGIFLAVAGAVVCLVLNRILQSLKAKLF